MPFKKKITKDGQRLNRKITRRVFYALILNLCFTDKIHKNPSVKVVSRIYLENYASSLWFNRVFLGSMPL